MFSYKKSLRFYSQAFKAVELGQRYGSHIAFFEDFRLSIISDSIISQFDLMDFCHPAVIQLINFDKQNGTNLLDTLKNYLYYTNSPNEAAKALFDFIKIYAKQQKCTSIHLDSSVDREEAHKFYLYENMKIDSYHFSIDLK